MYNIHGNAILGYDIGGNQKTDASESGTSELIHNTISYQLQTNYGDKIDTSYARFKAYYEEHPTAIPFFVVTDQHGTRLDLLRYINNLDARDKLNFYKFQLGDFCYDYFTDNYMANLLETSKDIDGYLSCVGNHDYKNSVNEFDSDVLKNSFTQDVAWYGCKWMRSQYKCYTAKDVKRNVKIIITDPYDSRGFISIMAHPWYNEEVVDWLITEMTNDDGCDLLMVQHEPYYTKSRSRTTSEPSANGDTNAPYIRPLIVARKNKQSGTFVDKEGISHAYDFTGCTGELLMSLHGHEHAERWDTDDFTCYACINGYGGTFGLIDAENAVLKIWNFSYDFIHDELEIPLV